MDNSLKQLALHCLDYTSLNDTDTEAQIREFCQQTTTPLGEVAAVCIYPQFIACAKDQLMNTSIKIATVVNFPRGEDSMASVLTATKAALAAGADEIDVVLPYRQYQHGDRAEAIDLIKAVKTVCQQHVLKVILETGEFKDAAIIEQAALDSLNAGADFIKTSTGKVAVGATVSAVHAMLAALQTYHQQTGQWRGLKVSGGLRQFEDAAKYIMLAQDAFGIDYISPKTFRIGASSLLASLLNKVEINASNSQHY